KGKIAGDQGRAALVTLRDQLEQQFRPGLGERHEAQLIDDKELVASHLLLEAQKTPFVASLHHLADESGGRDKADCQALLAGGQTETEGDMSFARAAGSERDDVLAALDPFTARQFQYLHLVELRNGGEVEAVEAFDDRELRRLDTAFDLAAVPLDHLPLG